MLVKALAWINLALAFVLEMIALYILGIFGFQMNLPDMGKWYFALIIPFVFICAWAILAAPKAQCRLKGWKLYGYKFVNFTLAAWALSAISQAQWAMLFEVVVAVNLVLLWVWRRFEPG